MSQETKKPVATFRARGVHVGVFENDSEKYGSVFYKCSVQRIYKDGDAFKTTTSLGRDDLPVARHLLQQAWEFILETEGKRPKEQSEES